MRRTWLRGVRWRTLRWRDCTVGWLPGNPHLVMVEGGIFENLIKWSLWHRERHIVTGFSPTPMRARLDAVGALRRELGMLPERAGWQRFTAGFRRKTDDSRIAYIFPAGRMVQWAAPAAQRGLCPTPEAAAEAAEKALGVRP